ncbi:helix-turn-helix transcriptional regulator [Microbispora bryophytorum]|uniref:Transcriptional regulator n=1 Tax=Microbispora bryophytorum TaxID=1460882 RepID=A0A8H9L981_9ACTN|nr:helix-turn-helix transcriptional regulator [Microbispora bryophytorum]MBD3135794.1 AAA family ATPase [Microbispora bryophytorum]TQS09945.1 AAA family ATPase [Microbispora bryophytorum]GGN99512.1 transcriptional regulator [Microbispora bryophytorum]
MLWGRATDHALIDGLLDRARAGRSGVLVVGGDPGIGKTSLLAYAAECAQDMRVLRGVGIETEAEIPFASLHLLLGHGLDRLDALPEPQAAALRGAFGLAPVTNRLLVGLAVLSLLAELAEGGPLLCLIDDAQWLDQESAQALRFAAHRLHAEGIVMIFAARDGFDPSGLPVHRLSGIDAGSAASLLAHAAPGLAPGTRDRVIEESCGNPLALLELPRTDLPAYDRSPLPLPARIQQAYEARIAELPPDAQKALLVTALTDGGDPDVIVRAGRELGIAPAALGVAEKSGLVTIDGGRVTFTHPLMRAAAFRHGTYDLRLEIHAILARLLDHQPDRRAWHLAAAATGPDETAARALEQAARRARERDGNAGACAALERAAELTEDHALKAGRLTEAAVAAADAGQARRARELVEDAAALVDDPRSRARLCDLRARIAFDEGAPHLAHDLLLAGAEELTALTSAEGPGGQARQDLIAAGLMLIDAARNAWQLSDPARVAEAAEHLHRLGLRPEDGLDPAVQAVTGAAALLQRGPAEGLPIMRGMVARGGGIASGAHTFRINAAFVAPLVGDFRTGHDISAAMAAECRATGDIGKLPLVHVTLAAAELYLGRFRDAEATATEGLRLTSGTGQRNRAGYLEGTRAWLAAVRGEADRCAELAARSRDRFDANHIVNGLAWAEWALALLDLGQGRFAEALDRLDTAMTGPVRHQIQAVYFAPDQIEAAVRLGLPAREPLRRFEEWATASGQDWALAVLHRCRALLETDWERAHEDFGAAVRLHAGSGRPWEAARTRLAFGERLRRERDKGSARPHLRAAWETFERLGARPWAERARTELRATGDTSSPAAPAEVLSALSPQELQIVRLAAKGLTNREIGAQLFLSPKTVSYHLYRAFPKLNVASRAQLAGLDLS